MGKRLYVGNLPFSLTEADLGTRFSEHGVVESVKLITDYDSGRSKGFGFVEMETQADAQAAIAGLDGTDLDGRAMKVNEARPPSGKTMSGRRGSSSREKW